uniref:ABC transporter channel subunit n=1 Tax=Ancoracysta twista TaxID=2044563 RepID=A0A2H4R8G9_9EUKA|nr:ABC transporter channel subunit [Ancoracysta twista]ATY40951.1 ABC transporter channel subunit [Ancoracysta twista]
MVLKKNLSNKFNENLILSTSLFIFFAFILVNALEWNKVLLNSITPNLLSLIILLLNLFFINSIFIDDTQKERVEFVLIYTGDLFLYLLRKIIVFWYKIYLPLIPWILCVYGVTSLNLKNLLFIFASYFLLTFNYSILGMLIMFLGLRMTRFWKEILPKLLLIPFSLPSFIFTLYIYDFKKLTVILSLISLSVFYLFILEKITQNLNIYLLTN